MKLLITTAFLILIITVSCKKEKDPPTLSASSLNSGRAGIKFTSSEAFNGSRVFEVINTVNTTATQKTIGDNVRNITLETTEFYDNAPTRKVIIDFIVPGSASTATGNNHVDLSRTAGAPPMAKIRLESYSLFGFTRESRSGTFTITTLTANEVEGTFDASVGAYNSTVFMNINGSFAGKL